MLKERHPHVMMSIQGNQLYIGKRIMPTSSEKNRPYNFNSGKVGSMKGKKTVDIQKVLEQLGLQGDIKKIIKAQ